MPVPEHTLIQADDMVLVLVDLQEKLIAAMSERDRVLDRAAKLARAAALVGAPIITTRQYPKGLGPFPADLEQLLMDLAQGGAHVVGVDKMAFCCGSEPSFMSALAATGRKQVVLVGMETHICVAQTALALASGHQVQVVSDACCSRDMNNHEVALDRLRAAGITVTVSESVMYEAVGVAGTDAFKELLAIVKD